MSPETIEVTDVLDEQEVSDSTHELRPINYEEAIEAILFAAGHPIPYDTLAKTFEIPLSEVKQIVYAYAEKYNNSPLKRGVTLITFDTCCQLCTKPEYIAEIRNALGIRKSSGTLSASTIEALTIIAYQQPVTRAYVDQVRTADSSYAMSNLLDRGLIEPKGRKDAPGRPVLYGTTNAFLRCFGLTSLADLPGSTGEAQSIFRSINDRLGLEDEGDGTQMSIDELFDPSAPQQDVGEDPAVTEEETAAGTQVPPPASGVASDDEEDWEGGAAEEAERAESEE